jgi:hypothetical protein
VLPPLLSVTAFLNRSYPCELPIDEAPQFKAADIAMTGFSEPFAAIPGERTLGLSLFIRKWNRAELNSAKREGPEQLSLFCHLPEPAA